MKVYVFDLADERDRRTLRSVVLALIDGAALPTFDDGDELYKIDDDTAPYHPDDLRSSDDLRRP